MTPHGPLALIGGGEHLPACATTDRWLLEATGAGRPHVVVLPVASLPVSVAASSALARNWWHRLGATVRVAHPDREPTEAVLDQVAAADLIVLPGGVPERVVAALGPSRIGDAILERWRGGAALSGSSAGAMALFTWRLRIASPRPLGLTPGLGAADGFVAVPHFDRLIRSWCAGRRFAEQHRRRLRGLGVLGLDESTALVVHQGRAEVRGPGRVTVGDAAGWRAYEALQAVEIDLGLPVAPLLDGRSGRIDVAARELPRRVA